MGELFWRRYEIPEPCKEPVLHSKSNNGRATEPRVRSLFGKSSKVRSWRRRWYNLPPNSRQKLRDAYGNDRERYYHSYQPDNEDFTYFQEAGMAAFVKMERKMLKGMRFEAYQVAGLKATKSFCAGLVDGGPSPSTTQGGVVFVSLDFEGAPNDNGICEVGLATLNSEHLTFPRKYPDFSCVNFALRKHRMRKFMFGNTVRLSPEILPRTITEFFDDLHRSNPHDEIILVCQGVRSEVQILDDLEIHLEGLPITGVLDTDILAKETLGYCGTLGNLLTKLQIPHKNLHCAGNDAHYTMQVLLAVLQSRHKECYDILERLARPPVPAVPYWKFDNKLQEESHHDWADGLELDIALLYDFSDLPEEDGHSRVLR